MDVEMSKMDALQRQHFAKTANRRRRTAGQVMVPGVTTAVLDTTPSDSASLSVDTPFRFGLPFYRHPVSGSFVLVSSQFYPNASVNSLVEVSSPTVRLLTRSVTRGAIASSSRSSRSGPRRCASLLARSPEGLSSLLKPRSLELGMNWTKWRR
ncbi:hypothetical protein TREMEDRAFT_57980 [Tremella mesenterica DSM 1558]|uniref:uncharacterized protein n=1 Tax=Tremella mesenterica (strain ATCC 24925 / CBS 8224 / DSM 1558 / NBRC 9311 / NRRL Y-6157 / RJB 2259-6 / UBC 559-6) TaxID=578456 RepID=UPI00032BD7FF|nr:uncharacterized protein TREMEDRAFT_57980 [Tremella mesenterica DSM 1558]EIW65587.1 hypothetical protein TREMEDRAFT_57980 [Tremella mesenterica DSM 1558]